MRSISGLVQRRDDRRHHHRRRNAGFGEQPKRRQSALGRRGPRFHRPGELPVERRHRQRDLAEVPLRHPRQDVDVAQDQRRLGDDADRMAGRLQHLEDLAHDPVALLDRLVGIGIGADRHGLRLIAGLGELALEQLRRVRLGEQPRLEIDAGRQAHIGMGRPREAVGAAVLAAAIGVDRPVEGDVRRLVGGDDPAAACSSCTSVRKRRKVVGRAPAVVEALPRLRLVAAGRVDAGASTPSPLGVDLDANIILDRLRGGDATGGESVAWRGHE